MEIKRKERHVKAGTEEINRRFKYIYKLKNCLHTLYKRQQKDQELTFKLRAANFFRRLS